MVTLHTVYNKAPWLNDLAFPNSILPMYITPCDTRERAWFGHIAIGNIYCLQLT